MRDWLCPCSTMPPLCEVVCAFAGIELCRSCLHTAPRIFFQLPKPCISHLRTLNLKQQTGQMKLKLLFLGKNTLNKRKSSLPSETHYSNPQIMAQFIEKQLLSWKHMPYIPYPFTQLTNEPTHASLGIDPVNKLFISSFKKNITEPPVGLDIILLLKDI